LKGGVMVQGLHLRIFRHWKAMSAIALIFISGFVLGIAGSAYYFKNKVRKFSDPANIKRVIDGKFNQMSKQLELTEEQINKIKPLLEKSALEMKHVREQNSLKLRQMRRSQMEKTIEVLTPEQIQKFKTLSAKRFNKENGEKMDKIRQKSGVEAESNVLPNTENK